MVNDEKDVNEMCNEVIEEILKNRKQFIEKFNKQKGRRIEEIKESEILDTKEGLTKILKIRLNSVLDSFYDEGIIGNYEFASSLEKLPKKAKDKFVDELCDENFKPTYLLRRKPFFIEDIKNLKDETIKKFLKEIDQRNLCWGLVNVSKEIVDKICNNMSKRAGEMVHEDIEYASERATKEEIFHARYEICSCFSNILELEEDEETDFLI